jgi:uncharacterized membrane protein YhaH (DUF805 family)
MRRQLIPVGIAIGSGLIVLVDQFITNPYFDNIGRFLVGAAAQIAAFALLLGLWNVLSVHVGRLARRDSNGWTSLVILLTAVLVFIVVLPSGGASRASDWVMRYLYRPLEASFLGLIVFFIATAAYRALRARSWETGLLLASALVVLVGSAALSNVISPVLAASKEWVMNVPMVAGVRGIALGVALGTILTGLRLLTGIDRPYSE